MACYTVHGRMRTFVCRRHELNIGSSCSSPEYDARTFTVLATWSTAITSGINNLVQIDPFYKRTITFEYTPWLALTKSSLNPG